MGKRTWWLEGPALEVYLKLGGEIKVGDHVRVDVESLLKEGASRQVGGEQDPTPLAGGTYITEFGDNVTVKHPNYHHYYIRRHQLIALERKAP